MTEPKYETIYACLGKNVQLLRAFRDEKRVNRGPFGVVVLRDPGAINNSGKQLTRNNLQWHVVKDRAQREKLRNTFRENGGADSCVVVACVEGCSDCKGIIFKTAPSQDHYTCCNVDCELLPGDQYRDYGMFQCPRCPLTTYCSAACQKEDWPNHKPYCGK